MLQVWTEAEVEATRLTVNTEMGDVTVEGLYDAGGTSDATALPSVGREAKTWPTSNGASVVVLDGSTLFQIDFVNPPAPAGSEGMAGLADQVVGAIRSSNP